jgi:APA family basic amino acid/polyamine antiporter
MGNFEQIIAYFIFVAVVFLGLTGVGLIISRSKNRGVEPTFRTPLYPVPPIAYLVLILALMLLLALHSGREAILGTIVVLIGVPVYSAFRRKRSGI